jgi:hypothetical protein
MLAPDLPDGVLCGVLAWFSVIHVPDERLPRAFAEFARVLAPGGLLLGFQARDTTLHLAEAPCRPVPLECAPGCCASPTTRASSPSASRRPTCWPANPALPTDGVLEGEC